jgi:hypothetical protein
MENLEIKQAQERLKVETEILDLKREYKKIGYKIESLEEGLKILLEDPNRYFRIMQSMKKLDL